MASGTGRRTAPQKRVNTGGWSAETGIGHGGLSHTETLRWIRKLQPRCAAGFSAMDPQGEIRIGELAFPGHWSDLKAAEWLWEPYTNHAHFAAG